MRLRQERRRRERNHRNVSNDGFLCDSVASFRLIRRIKKTCRERFSVKISYENKIIVLISFDVTTTESKHDAECGNRVDEPINLSTLHCIERQMKSMILYLCFYLISAVNAMKLCCGKSNKGTLITTTLEQKWNRKPTRWKLWSFLLHRWTLYLSY